MFSFLFFFVLRCWSVLVFSLFSSFHPGCSSFFLCSFFSFFSVLFRWSVPFSSFFAGIFLNFPSIASQVPYSLCHWLLRGSSTQTRNRTMNNMPGSRQQIVLYYVSLKPSKRQHNKDERPSSSEKYTSHFIWKGCVWEGVGDRTVLKHIDPHSYGHNSILSSSPGQLNRGPGGPAAPGAGFLYRILSPIGLIFNGSDLQLIEFPVHWVQPPPSSCKRPNRTHSTRPQSRL